MLRPCERRRGLLTTREGGTEAYRERDQMRKFFAASENIIDLRDHFMAQASILPLKSKRQRSVPGERQMWS
jgi:hypothetical protein